MRTEKEILEKLEKMTHYRHEVMDDMMAAMKTLNTAKAAQIKHETGYDAMTGWEGALCWVLDKKSIEFEHGKIVKVVEKEHGT